jgi:hypothetical protein
MSGGSNGQWSCSTVGVANPTPPVRVHTRRYGGAVRGSDGICPHVPPIRQNIAAPACRGRTCPAVVGRAFSVWFACLQPERPLPQCPQARPLRADLRESLRRALRHRSRRRCESACLLRVAGQRCRTCTPPADCVADASVTTFPHHPSTINASTSDCTVSPVTPAVA